MIVPSLFSPTGLLAIPNLYELAATHPLYNHPVERALFWSLPASQGYWAPLPSVEVTGIPLAEVNKTSKKNKNVHHLRRTTMLNHRTKTILRPYKQALKQTVSKTPKDETSLALIHPIDLDVPMSAIKKLIKEIEEQDSSEDDLSFDFLEESEDEMIFLKNAPFLSEESF